jgi:hypothetical protein
MKHERSCKKINHRKSDGILLFYNLLGQCTKVLGTLLIFLNIFVCVNFLHIRSQGKRAAFFISILNFCNPITREPLLTFEKTAKLSCYSVKVYLFCL